MRPINVIGPPTERYRSCDKFIPAIILRRTIRPSGGKANLRPQDVPTIHLTCNSALPGQINFPNPETWDGVQITYYATWPLPAQLYWSARSQCQNPKWTWNRIFLLYLKTFSKFVIFKDNAKLSRAKISFYVDHS